MGGWVAPLITGLAALAGGTNKQKMNTTSTTNYDRIQQPYYDFENLGFRNNLIQSYKDRMAGSPAFDAAYRNQGNKQILDQGSAIADTVNGFLASRGLGRTTAGGNTLRDFAFNQAKRSADFNNQATLDLDTRYGNILKEAAGYQSSIPVGTKMSGQDVTTGTQVGGPINPWMGAIQGFSSAYAGLLGQQQEYEQKGKLLKQLEDLMSTRNPVTPITPIQNFTPTNWNYWKTWDPLNPARG